MKRIHAFEINDQPWCPIIFRNMITEYLQFIARAFRIYDGVIPSIEKVLSKTGSDSIVDLCSGASGPWSHLLRHTDRIDVVLTDKFPNLASFERISSESDGRISFSRESIDATDVPEKYEGMRTIFTGLHHFHPEPARKILQDAAEKGRAIGIFEFTERSLPAILSALLGIPLMVLLFTPFITPFKPSRLFWTYIIPVAPLLIMWDGLISDLRTYSVAELRELVSPIKTENYSWEIGKQKSGVLGMNITYLIGCPDKPA